MASAISSVSQSAFQQQANVRVASIPFVSHHLAALRSKTASSQAFRASLKAVAYSLLAQASAQFPTVTHPVETPLATLEATMFNTQVPLYLVPILRAGLAFSDAALELFPWATTYHLGLFRDEQTLKPVEYYNKLPETLMHPEATTLLLDPMLATGGSALACIELLVSKSVQPEQILFICLIASPEGIEAVHQRYPQVTIYTAAVDKCLNEKGYIVPGLGDAGDRFFAT